ncbi:MAG TPA: response regulator [Candidatus Limiplasma sp.]|mgnify:CR=1 FL=1|nr:response regulator [Candidatus Limiplasma sp.]HPR77101.1 response regulator [Candidatus Limiplasma sp.]
MFKILVVEDNPLILEGICKMIDWDRCDGVLVGKAQDGDEALQLMADQLPDLVITDIRMPGKDGIFLLQHIQKNHAEMQTIVVSAYNEFSYAKEAIKAGSVNYLLKPIDPDELNAAVMTASERKNASGIQEKIGGETPTVLAVLKTKEPYPIAEIQKRYRSVPGLYLDEVHPSLFCFEMSAPMNAASLSAMRTLVTGEALWGFAGRNPDDSMITMYQRALHTAADDLTYSRRAADGKGDDLDDKKISVLALAGQADKIIQTLRRRAADALQERISFQALTSVIFHMLLVVQSDEYIHYSVFKKLEYEINLHTTDLIFFSVEEVLDKAETAIAEYCKASIRADSERIALCEQVANLIQKNMDQDISLEEIAGLFYISPSYLSRTFRQLKGQTISQYTMQVRMEQAQYLLNNSDLKIADVAVKVGYPDPNYFTRVYKKYTGSLPSNRNKK